MRRSATRRRLTCAREGREREHARDPATRARPARCCHPSCSYALGLVIYCLLTGFDTPWPYVYDYDERTIRGERPDCGLLRPDAPPALVGLMIRAWAQLPGDRPSAAEMADALSAILQAVV